MFRHILVPLMAAAILAACSQATAPPVGIPTPDPAAAAAFEALSPSDGFYLYDGLDSMEETILEADVIARVSLVSKRPDVIQVDDTTWYPVLEFRFRVHEYLKGSGSNEIGGLVYLWLREATEANARTAAAQMPAAHDSRWDNREAIVFLETERIFKRQVLPLGPDQHWFGPIREGGWVYGISVSSPHSKRWLPEVAKSAGTRTTASSEKLFLTDDPLGPETVFGRRIATRNPDSPLPTISLSTLKTRISALEAEANAGGTAEYRTCIEQSYVRLRYKAFALRGGPTGWRRDFTIPSGLPAGTIIDDLGARPRII